MPPKKEVLKKNRVKRGKAEIVQCSSLRCSLARIPRPSCALAFPRKPLPPALLLKKSSVSSESLKWRGGGSREHRGPDRNERSYSCSVNSSQLAKLAVAAAAAVKARAERSVAIQARLRAPVLGV